MRDGSVVVDVAIDQGGCFETSRPTTHTAPTYIEEGVVHYCVTNMPGAVAHTSALALNNATLPFVKALADRGPRGVERRSASGGGLERASRRDHARGGRRSARLSAHAIVRSPHSRHCSTSEKRPNRGVFRFVDCISILAATFAARSDSSRRTSTISLPVARNSLESTSSHWRRGSDSRPLRGGIRRWAASVAVCRFCSLFRAVRLLRRIHAVWCKRSSIAQRAYSSVLRRSMRCGASISTARCGPIGSSSARSSKTVRRRILDVGRQRLCRVRTP